MKTITENELFTAVADVVRSNPNYVYKDAHYLCHYYDFVADAPMCLFGHAFEQLGIRTKSAFNASQINKIVGDRSEEVFEDGVHFDLSDAMITACVDAQNAQDTGASWAEAFKVMCKTLNRSFNESKSNE